MSFFSKSFGQIKFMTTITRLLTLKECVVFSLTTNGRVIVKPPNGHPSWKKRSKASIWCKKNPSFFSPNSSSRPCLQQKCSRGNTSPCLYNWTINLSHTKLRSKHAAGPASTPSLNRWTLHYPHWSRILPVAFRLLFVRTGLLQLWMEGTMILLNGKKHDNLIVRGKKRRFREKSGHCMPFNVIWRTLHKIYSYLPTILNIFLPKVKAILHFFVQVPHYSTLSSSFFVWLRHLAFKYCSQIKKGVGMIGLWWKGEKGRNQGDGMERDELRKWGTGPPVAIP